MSGRGAAVSRGSGKASAAVSTSARRVWCGWFILAEYGRSGAVMQQLLWRTAYQRGRRLAEALKWHVCVCVCVMTGRLLSTICETVGVLHVACLRVLFL